MTEEQFELLCDFFQRAKDAPTPVITHDLIAAASALPGAMERAMAEQNQFYKNTLEKIRKELLDQNFML